MVRTQREIDKAIRQTPEIYDRPASEADRVFESIKQENRRNLEITLPVLLALTGLSVRDFSKRKYSTALFKAYGLDIALTNAQIREILEPWEIQNKSLITRRTNDKIDLAKEIYTSAKRKKTPKTKLKREIAEFLRKQRGALNFILEDQVFNLDGAFDRATQVNAGFGEYIWTTKLDGRVRPKHRARHGLVFSWASPPSGGHPKEDYACRCSAAPYIEIIFT